MQCACFKIKSYKVARQTLVFGVSVLCLSLLLDEFVYWQQGLPYKRDLVFKHALRVHVCCLCKDAMKYTSPFAMRLMCQSTELANSEEVLRQHLLPNLHAHELKFASWSQQLLGSSKFLLVFGT